MKRPVTSAEEVLAEHLRVLSVSIGVQAFRLKPGDDLERLRALVQEVNSVFAMLNRQRKYQSVPPDVA